MKENRGKNPAVRHRVHLPQDRIPKFTPMIECRSFVSSKILQDSRSQERQRRHLRAYLEIKS
jgi:hypothetical protein